MTTFYLIRHGSNDFLVHTLVGRMPGVHLNEAGRREAALVAEALASRAIQHVFTSPLDRCRETAEPVARELGLVARVAEELAEVDFGAWTGKTFAELDATESWRSWNAFRSGARAPGGESMQEVQARMVGFVERLRRAFPDQGIALVSHGDPIRSVLLYFFGMSLDLIRRIELFPASVSAVAVNDWEARVLCVNSRPGNDYGFGRVEGAGVPTDV